MSNQQSYRLPPGFNPTELHPNEGSVQIPHIVDFYDRELLRTIEIRRENILDITSERLGGVVLMGVTDTGWLVTLYKKDRGYMLSNELLSREDLAEIATIQEEDSDSVKIQLTPTQEEATVTFLPQSQESPEEEVA